MTKKKDETPVSEAVSKRIEQYVLIRDKLKELDDEFEKKRAPLVEVQNLISGYLQSVLDTIGPEASIKTSMGTCFCTTRYTASLADPDIFMKHVISTGKFELLDRRANATAVKDYAHANAGALPPGVNLNAMRSLSVRRKSGK